MKKLTDELKELRFELGVVQREKCSVEETQHFQKLKKEGTPLPQDVFYNSGGPGGAIDPEFYYREVSSNLSEKEINELLLYRQTLYLKSIRNGVIFFVVLTIISMIVTLVLFRSF